MEDKTAAAAAAADLKKLDWAKSAAKAMMAQDMMDGLVPFNEEIKNKEKLYNDMYAGTPEFEDWPYNKDAFYRRIRSLQQTVCKMMQVRDIDAAAFLHDRNLHPAPNTAGGPTQYTNGAPLWENQRLPKS